MLFCNSILRQNALKSFLLLPARLIFLPVLLHVVFGVAQSGSWREARLLQLHIPRSSQHQGEGGSGKPIDTST